MQQEHKKGLRWWIFNLFGPTEVQNLVTHIDDLTKSDLITDIVIWPVGEFAFSVRTSVGDDVEPMIFPTLPERNAFQHGLSYGVTLMGGASQALDEEQYQALEQMNKKSTHGGGGGRNN